MKPFVALRRSITREGHKNLPRPKIVQEVLLIGDKQTCQELIDELVLKPEHQTTDQVAVELWISPYDGQKSYNSRDVLPHGKNSYGKR